MANVKSLKDMQEENDDDKRQAYYAGGQGQNGGGRCAPVCHPHKRLPAVTPRASGG